jgi:septal ring factor EnvC (AmiA/AmiB activator)
VQRPSATAVARATDGAAERPRLALAPPPLPRRRVVTRTRALVALLVVLLAAANALVLHNLATTAHEHRQLVAEQRAADLRVAESRDSLTGLRTGLARVQRLIEQSAAARERANANAKRVNRSAEATRAAATSNIEAANADRTHTELLHACLTVLHSAMNAFALDDHTSGANELRVLDAECTAPNP